MSCCIICKDPIDVEKGEVGFQCLCTDGVICSNTECMGWIEAGNGCPNCRRKPAIVEKTPLLDTPLLETPVLIVRDPSESGESCGYIAFCVLSAILYLIVVRGHVVWVPGTLIALTIVIFPWGFAYMPLVVVFYAVGYWKLVERCTSDG